MGAALDDGAEAGVQLGMTFLEGSNIRDHHKAAGAVKRGQWNPTCCG